MEQELERLVEVGDLYRLFYKGSPSFRIVPPEAKAKRRQVSQKPADAEHSRLFTILLRTHSVEAISLHSLYKIDL